MAEVEREWKEDTSRPAPERVALWWRFDEIMNMKPSEMRSFRESEFGQKVGLDKREAESAGLSVMSGQEASKIIEKMLNSCSKLRGQHKKLPDWDKEEWDMAGRAIGMISRFRGNIGDLEDEEGNPTPKAGAMMLWGRNEIKAPAKFPDKEEIKAAVRKEYQEQKEEEKRLKEKKKEREQEAKQSEKLKQKDMNKKKPLHESYHEMANYLLDEF